jgi:group I intron endonuclease
MAVNKYHGGKVYKIINNLNNEIYVGSTCERLLSRRMGNHKCDAKKETCKSRPLYKHMNELGAENFRIVSLEDYKCDTIDQLQSREQYYIDLLKPVYNMHQAVHSPEYRQQYREANKERISAMKKQYRSTHLKEAQEYREIYAPEYRANAKATWPLLECIACKYSTVWKEKYNRHCSSALHNKRLRFYQLEQEKNNEIPIEMINDLFHYIV